MDTDSQKKILRAAEALFNEYGFKDTKIQDISKRAGVAVGTIYKHYRSKDEIFLEIGNPDLKNIIPSQDKRRKEIIEAVLNLFGTKGFSRTNMEDISKELGMSKGMIYQYFKSKDDLLIAMVKETSQIQKLWHMTLTQERKNLEEELTEIGMGLLGFYKDQRIVKLIRTIIAETPNFPEIGQFFYKEVIQKVSTLLGSNLEPHLPPQSDPILSARLFLGSLWSFVITQQMIQVNSDIFDDESIVKEAVRNFIHGAIKADIKDN
ncbi:TetR/AcrR family transcriptional regulator [Clostridium tagluense]|uniref:TetR/AcrR family transcriptional regulator n=1 Tax=Clostridium tagluense TaxID=360422 RepID=UPI001C0D5911|nr:TetR/AcrR family transcriptional regulator [Clostridium tagluense]MBU3130469.1 TetR/AcrR family transcriptional regulator; helix-turn-helix transcriptional regulator [Clostridium tagluense]